jgi:citrate lyase subunit beta / citryl-CoA lyase
MSVTVTYLYAPADRPDRAAKALASGADVALLDLEDAVAPDHKDEARANLAELVAAFPGRAVQVRVNALGTPWHEADLRVVAALPVHVGLRLPKAEDPGVVQSVAEAVGERGVHLLLETALGIERAYEVAFAHSRIASLGMGEADLRSDLGVDSEDALVWVRLRVVVAARAAHLSPPAMSAFTNVSDLDGLAASCARGKALGFLGRAAIHPRQLPVIAAAFAPTDEEIERATAVIERVGDAHDSGSGTVVLADGTFLDAAMVERARQVVALAERRADD